MGHTEHYINPMEKSMQDKRLRDLLERESSARVFPAGKMIYFQGDQADCFYYLKSGAVKVFLSSENGTEKIVAVPKEGSVFGEAAFFDGLPRVSSAAAVKQSKIITVGRDQLLGYFKQYPELAMDMMRHLSRTVRMLSSQLDHMAFLQADRQIASLLLQMRSAGTGNNALCRHEEIAQLVGVSRVTVSKILKRFVSEGWIRTRYRAVEILDADALLRFSENS